MSDSYPVSTGFLKKLFMNSETTVALHFDRNIYSFVKVCETVDYQMSSFPVYVKVELK